MISQLFPFISLHFGWLNAIRHCNKRNTHKQKKKIFFLHRITFNLNRWYSFSFLCNTENMNWRFDKHFFANLTSYRILLTGTTIIVIIYQWIKWHLYSKCFNLRFFFCYRIWYEILFCDHIKRKLILGKPIETENVKLQQQRKHIKALKILWIGRVDLATTHIVGPRAVHTHFPVLP